MARLRPLERLVLPLLMLMQSQPAPAQTPPEWDAPIAEASARFGVPAAWIRRVIQAESGGRTTLNGRPIRSPAGAMGLMQLMPGTWRAMRRMHGLGPDPDNPHDNILAGTAYLRAMYDRFGYPGLFAAYNAGPARYADHLARGRWLSGETLAYVAKVTGTGRAFPMSMPTVAEPEVWAGPIMVQRSGDSPADRASAASKADLSGVFFQLGNAPPR